MGILLLAVAAALAPTVAVTKVSAFNHSPATQGQMDRTHRLCNAVEQGRGSAGAVFPCFSSLSKTAQIQILLFNPFPLEIPSLVSLFMPGSLPPFKSTKEVNINKLHTCKEMHTHTHTHI